PSAFRYAVVDAISLALLRPPPSPTLFPYTTLFRSSLLREPLPRPEVEQAVLEDGAAHRAAVDRLRPFRLAEAVGVVEERVGVPRSEEHTSELQSRENLVCRLLLEKKKRHNNSNEDG